MKKIVGDWHTVVGGVFIFRNAAVGWIVSRIRWGCEGCRSLIVMTRLIPVGWKGGE